MAWFLGQYVFTLVSFLLAICLSAVTHSLLQKASLITLALFFIALTFQYKDIIRKTKSIYKKKPKITVLFFAKALISTLLLWFSYAFFHNQLFLHDGVIYITHAYWDFRWHMPLIQNFVYGDNFPPQNEFFANFPHTYHFFWGVLVAIYSSLGLNIVFAINYVSSMSMFFLFLAIIGFAEDVFESAYVGFFAVIFTVTSSSLRFIDYYLSLSNRNPLLVIISLITNTSHPFFNSFIEGDPYGYNGTMFNMFYFLAERQMIVGMIFLIFCLWLIYQRRHFNQYILLGLGSLMGLYFLWHLYISIMVLCALFFILLLDRNKQKTTFLLLGFGVVFLFHYIYFKLLLQSPLFLPDILHYPQMSFNFPTMDDKYTFSILNAGKYYVYAYGFKVVLLPLGILTLWKKNKQACFVIISIILPTFILINTIQLSPLSIYENHKWLRPMNIVIDLICAYGLYYIYLKRTAFPIRLFGIMLFMAVILTGFIELPPFFNARADTIFSKYDSSFTQVLRERTKPKAVFVTQNATEVHLAGRKIFLGDSTRLKDYGLNGQKRQEVVNTIYAARNVDEFCDVTKGSQIDFVEYDNINHMVPYEIASLASFEVTNASAQKVIFVDVLTTCK